MLLGVGRHQSHEFNPGGWVHSTRKLEPGPGAMQLSVGCDFLIARSNACCCVAFNSTFRVVLFDCEISFNVIYFYFDFLT